MNTETLPILSQPRSDVRLTFNGGLVLQASVGTTLEAFMLAAQAQAPEQFREPIIAGIIDGKLRELTYPIKRDARVEPIVMSMTDGGRIYRRSLVLLLTTAISELYPEARVNVGYAVPDGGFYCTVRGREPLNEVELNAVEAYMQELVAEDIPIQKRVVALDEATALFDARGDDDKVRLLEQRDRPELAMYSLRSRSDYYFGYMVPSTGYLKTFRLTQAHKGFILQYPKARDPQELTRIPTDSSKIATVFETAEQWLNRIGVEDVGRLNRLVREDNVQELILVAEAQHEQQIAYIAGEVYRRHHDHGLRLVLIAGPSSSGKTTFSKRLAIQLLAYGLRPFTLELDNYFVDRELTPRDEEGNFDFESLEAINLPLFNNHLLRLIQGEEVRLPAFDFVSGRSVEGSVGRLTDNQILICEGIHGMNPQLVTQIPNEKIFRVYVSALTQLNLDAHNRIPTTDVRLLRRICRDAVRRGYNAQATINRWESVRRGEKRNIFPYQENADVMFNSALVYELAALRRMAEPLLLQVEPTTRAHIEANRLLSFLRWVHPVTPDQEALIPDTSLLREFIGGSILDEYHPGALETRDV